MSLSLSVDDLPRLLVMLVLAALLGYVADLFTGGRVPLRFFGTILFGLLGAWVAASGAVEVAVPGAGRWVDPASSVATKSLLHAAQTPVCRSKTALRRRSASSSAMY